MKNIYILVLFCSCGGEFVQDNPSNLPIDKPYIYYTTDGICMQYDRTVEYNGKKAYLYSGCQKK